MIAHNVRKASPIICTIHGNAATFNSFSFIKKCLPEYEYLDLSYDSRMGFWNNLKHMEDCLSSYPEEEFVFLSHSLGGIYAAYLASFFRKRTLAMITMATPFAGCEAAGMLNLLAPSQLFKDIRPSSDVMRGVQQLDIKCPVTAIVTTSGQSSLWTKINDGIVSRESMLALKGDVAYYDVHAKHNEILLHEATVKIVEEAIEQAFQKSKDNALINEMEECDE
jgi:pimeloyl-ACP methyl ester carboxylesterase